MGESLASKPGGAWYVGDPGVRGEKERLVDGLVMSEGIGDAPPVEFAMGSAAEGFERGEDSWSSIGVESWIVGVFLGVVISSRKAREAATDLCRGACQSGARVALRDQTPERSVSHW